MNKWLALLLIVIVVILDKHIGALISLKKFKSEEKITENNRRTAEAEERQSELNKLEAEAKQLTAQLQKQTAERISAMNHEQIAAYNKTILLPQIVKLVEEICHQNIHFLHSK